jgi:hypothetical protein
MISGIGGNTALMTTESKCKRCSHPLRLNEGATDEHPGHAGYRNECGKLIEARLTRDKKLQR